ncbi:MAG: adenylyl-sulfate kinase [Ekhidna sp.]|nr:adenylyl-sulfate kinase [Ekhidna sp.]MBC6409954.1 adenylyl-sulfate kinase [Ekhidna sp.]MBC6426832.1 adenylyl-sulfate kinase [Ekhidna sp.]
MVISFIGKSGSGKSTIANSLATILKETHSNVLVIDGDELRSAIAPDLGFTYEDREQSEERRSKLMKVISDQGIHVICAGLSNYPQWREWCRDNVKDYFEIYLKVPQSILEDRDAKGIYERFRNGEINNVIGLDIPFVEPSNPDITISNDGSREPRVISESILSNLPD